MEVFPVFPRAYALEKSLKKKSILKNFLSPHNFFTYCVRIGFERRRGGFRGGSFVFCGGRFVLFSRIKKNLRTSGPSHHLLVTEASAPRAA